MSDIHECDMLVNLYALPQPGRMPAGVEIVRAFAGDKDRIVRSLRLLAPQWTGEVERAILQLPSTCFLAVADGKPVGFACYDATARGYFGPTAVLPAYRGRGVGRALLLTALHAMRGAGYGYAVIGWAGEAAPFYEKTVGARYIEGGEPQNTLYTRSLTVRKQRKPS